MCKFDECDSLIVQNVIEKQFFSLFSSFLYRGVIVVSLVDDTSGPFHKDSIRAIGYSANGNLFVSAGDVKDNFPLITFLVGVSTMCITYVSYEFAQ